MSDEAAAELARALAALRKAREALTEAYRFHCRIECIDEDCKPCTCHAFDPLRAALSDIDAVLEGK